MLIILIYHVLYKVQCNQLLVRLELAQFPVSARSGGGSTKRTSDTSAFIRLAKEVVDAIWLDLGALNHG